MQELKPRNQKIYAEKLQGATYRELSLKYGLTQERIFQIVDREKLREKYGENWKRKLIERQGSNGR